MLIFCKKTNKSVQMHSLENNIFYRALKFKFGTLALKLGVSKIRNIIKPNKIDMKIEAINFLKVSKDQWPPLKYLLE